MKKIEVCPSEFVKWLDPKAPSWGATKVVNGAMYGMRLDPKAANHIDKTLGDFVRQGRNVYFNPNAAPADAKIENNRLKKSDATVVRFVHLDIDPPDELNVADHLGWRESMYSLLTHDRPKHVPHPSAIINSGNGLQALWRLAEPSDDVERAEEINRSLIAVYKGDPGTFDISRLLRFPGTVNIPEAKKVKRGRTKQPTELLYWDANTVGLATFESLRQEMMPRVQKGARDDGPVSLPEIGDIQSVEDLHKLQAKYPAVSDRVWVIVNHGRHPDEPKKGRDDTRSAWLFDACCNLLRGGVPPEIVLGLIMDPDYSISESILELPKGRAESYARKNVRDALKHIANDETPIQKAMREGEFILTDKGKPRHDLMHNRYVAVAKLGISVRRDMFNDAYVLEGLEGFEGRMTDAAVTRMRALAEKRFQLTISKDAMRDVICDIGEDNRFHPVAEYLDEQTWDGVKRVEGWLTAYLGVQNTPYSRAVGTLFLTAAVRRIRKPGCKFDEMMVLEGSQGGGKSTALRILARSSDWFTDELPLGANGKEIIEATEGKWIVEAAELVGHSKKDNSNMKSMLSRTFDKGRKAYGYFSDQKERQFVICGTTNDDRYLKDKTGNRRYWPVRCGTIDLTGLKRDADQLWAEASLIEAQGASIRLDPSLYEAAAEEQAERQEENPLEAKCSELVAGVSGWLPCGQMYDALRVPQNSHNGLLIRDAMAALGWEKKRSRALGGNVWYYVSGQEPCLLEVRQNRDTGRWFVAEVSGSKAGEPEAEMPF